MSDDAIPLRATAGTFVQTAWRCLGFATVSAITFILVRIAVLNIFYTTGDMRDPGWLAFITWHNGWRLRGPPGFPGPFFSEHVAPILWLTNAVSFVVPLGRYDYYAAVIASSHALFAAGVYAAWQLTEVRRSAAGPLLGVPVALAAAFSAVGVISLGLPHFEMAIPAFALWFFIFLAKRAYLGAAAWFAVCLAVREDAGFHLFGILMLWAGVTIWTKRRLTREVRLLLGFAVAAFCYSAVAFAAKQVWFPDGDILWRSYLGYQPLHHVTASFVLDRLRYFLTDRTYVTLPFLLSIAWAWFSRNPLLPVGYLATAPWLVLTILAVHPTPGVLAYYYGFPFWLALAWPLVAMRIRREANDRRAAHWPYALLLLASLVGWQRDRLVVYPLMADHIGEAPFAWNDPLRERTRYQVFVDYYWTNRPLFGATALDQAVSGLLIDRVGRDGWLEYWRDKPPPDTIIYFEHGFEWPTRVWPLVRSGIYQCVYAVPETRILVASQVPLGPRLPAPMPLLIVKSALGAGC
jgi:hypothetical protein